MTTITTRSGKGSPLTNDEVDANFTNLNDDKVEASGDSMTGNLSFGDNNKAIFGAGSDLQIYHDGTHSYINEGGTGNLNINANNFVVATGAPSYEYMMQALPDGGVLLYHNGNQKLATTSTGVDVTGTVTADSATIDGAITVNGAGINLDDAYSLTWGDGSAQVRGSGASEAIDLRTASTTRLNIDADGDLSLYNSAGTSQDLFWDASTSRLGLGTTSPSTTLDVAGTVTANNLTLSDSFPVLKIEDSDGTNQNLEIVSSSGASFITARNGSSNGTINLRRTDGTTTSRTMQVTAAGDVALYADDGTTQAFYWDASTSRLGLGTTLPSHEVHLVAASPQIRLQDDGGTNTYGDVQFNGTALSLITRGGASSHGVMRFQSNNGTDNLNRMEILSNGDIRFYDDTETARLRWDASASNLGIGNDSPAVALDVHDSGDATIRILSTGTGVSDDTILRSQISGTTASNYLYFGDADDNNSGQVRYVHSDDSMRFYAGATTERLRLYSTSTIFYNGTTEIARFNSSNNFGIGTPSPAAKLHVDSSTTSSAITLRNTSGTAGLDLVTSGTGGFLYNRNNDALVFGTNNTEKARIDASGNLFVGCSSTPSATVHGFGVNPAGVVRTSRDGTGAASHYIFHNDNGDVGSIDTSGTSTSYTTSSDQRLKDNIVDAPSASDDIDAIQVRSFDWKADGSHQKYGMVAQELQSVAPEAVSEGETEEDMMGVDYSKLVPMLVKEIQSLRARVAQLEGAN